MITYRLAAEDREGRRFQIPLREGVNIIGRSDTCDVRIDDIECSRRHAVLRLDDMGLFIADLRSENCTFVNHSAIGQQEKQLKTGDEIIVGVTALTVELDEPDQGESHTMVNVMQARHPVGKTTIESRLLRKPKTVDQQTRTIKTADLRREARRKIADFARFPYLEVMGPASDKKRYLLRQPLFTIGRAQDNHLVLREQHVSAHHAQIQRTQEGYIIRDRQSRNGVFVNGKKVDKHLLRANHDAILLGDTRLRFFMPRI